MATRTFRPVVQRALRSRGNTTFADARAGNNTVELQDDRQLPVNAELNPGPDYFVVRQFLFFETASLKGSIESVTLTINVQQSAASGDDNIHLVVATPGSNSALTTNDWASVGSTNLATAVDATSTGEKTFTLNASGIAVIDTTKNTVFALLNENDINNDTPADSENGAPRVYTILNETESTHPLLTVNFTPANNQAFII